ncbi:pyruvate kinase [Mycoplasma suis]|nr:pyruvate kinase [Mycoplasma suis]
MMVKQFPLKCTKIVATIGPAVTLKLDPSATKAKNPVEYGEVLSLFNELFFNGLNCVRFNFSHSNDEERIFRLNLLREAKKEFFNYFNRIDKDGNSPYKVRFVFPISEMCDTKGPEIRVCAMREKDGQQYKRGQTVRIHCIDKCVGNSECFSVTDSTGKYNMAADCIVGEKVLVDDGKLSLLIKNVNVEEGIVEVVVENDHILKGNKRINLPNAEYSMEFLSERDKDDILFSLKNGFSFIALSFVNKQEDILEVKKLISENIGEGKKSPLIISKIETTQSLKNIDEIILHSDGIMIARGDLALETPFEEVPFWTKKILSKAAQVGKPVIVATQMLDSLERTVVPTRAEVSDVYRAAELSADSTMLSGETAQGLFPLIAVSTMAKIVQAGEKHCNYLKLQGYYTKEIKSSRLFNLSNLLHEEHNKFPYALACFMFEESISEEELLPLSKLKLIFPLVIFSRKKSFEEATSDMSSQVSSIFRGIYRVSLLNSTEESLEDCAKMFLNLAGFEQDSSTFGASGRKTQTFMLYEKGGLRVIPF